MKRLRAFSLVEIAIVILLSGTLLLVSGTQFIAFQRSFDGNRRLVEAESDFIAIGKLLERYFARATGIAFTQKGGATTQTKTIVQTRSGNGSLECSRDAQCFTAQTLVANSCTRACNRSESRSCGKDCTESVCVEDALSWQCEAKGLAGFLVHEEGIGILSSDLRACDQFNPATSSDPKNQTQIRIMCCEQNMRIRAAVPAPPGVVVESDVTSMCTNSTGLSLELVRTVVLGAPLPERVFSLCFRHVNRMNIAGMGFDETRQSEVFYFNFSSSPRLTTVMGKPIEGSHARSEFYVPLGHSGQGLFTTCQEGKIQD